MTAALRSRFMAGCLRTELCDYVVMILVNKIRVVTLTTLTTLTLEKEIWLSVELQHVLQHRWIGDVVEGRVLWRMQQHFIAIWFSFALFAMLFIIILAARTIPHTLCALP